MKCAVTVLAAVVVTVSLSQNPKSLPVGENWPQWRGPDGLGIAHAAGYPLEWSPTQNIAWKTPVAGRGHSSPIVWGNRVWRFDELVVCGVALQKGHGIRAVAASPRPVSLLDE
jgi:hypothetical protein